MISLGIDTSTPAGSIALVEDGRIRGELNLDAGGHHQERLLRSVDALFDLLGLTIAQVDVLSVALGPGSFTGLRVGIATVKGLGLARRIPVYGLSTLAALALRFGGRGLPVAPMIDAGRREVYAALYDVDGEGPRALLAERAEAPDRFLASLPPRPVVLCGDGARHYRDRIRESRGPGSIIEAEDCFLGGTLARWGAKQMERTAPWSLGELRPNYLRPADAEIGRTH